MEAKGRKVLEGFRGKASEGHAFDELTKGLASGTISRGRAMKLAGAAILGSTGLLALFPGKAQAQGCTQGDPSINNHSCEPIDCGGTGTAGLLCVCAETVHGKNHCVPFGELECPERDQCDRNKDCPGDQLCIKVGACCSGTRRNLCIPKCGGAVATG
jgi:hypothetical protein